MKDKKKGTGGNQSLNTLLATPAAQCAVNVGGLNCPTSVESENPLSNSGFLVPFWNKKEIINPSLQGVDMASFTVSVPSYRSESERNRAFWDCWEIQVTKGNTKRLNGDVNYRNAVMYHGIWVGWDRIEKTGGRDSVRVEYNPQKNDADKLLPLLQLLAGFGDLRRLKFTRLDWFQDYDCSLSPGRFFKSRVNTGRVWYGAGGIESHYIGSPTSNVQVRIYDKAKQYKRDRAYVNGSLEVRAAYDLRAKRPWHRVEVEDKRGWYVAPKIMGASSPDADDADFNPFARLVYVSGFPDDFTGACWASYVRQNGAQAFVSALRSDCGRSAGGRKRFKRIMADIEVASVSPRPSPADTWDSSALSSFRRSWLIRIAEAERRNRTITEKEDTAFRRLELDAMFAQVPDSLPVP